MNRSVAALLLGAVGIAFAPIFVRLSPLAPTATAFWRLALAAPLLWLWVRTERRPLPGSWLPLIWPGVFFAGDLALWHWSLQFTSVANSTLLANMMPVFVTLGGFLLFGRRFRKVFLVGMVLALGGAGVMSGAKPEQLSGDLLALSTAVFYAAYILSVGRLREQRYTTAQIMAWSSTIAGILLLPVALLSGEALWTDDVDGWMILLGLALVSHVGGQGLIAWALAHLPAAFSAVTLLVQPVTAAALAWVIFSEALTGVQTAGAVLVLSGILIARRGSRPSTPPTAS